MELPDTQDSTPALWAKLLTNLGGTPTGDLREALRAILSLLAA